MYDLLNYILTSILPVEATIQIEEVQEEGDRVTFNITVPEEFRGMLIGKDGNTINAIRRIINVRAKREEKFANIKILD